MQMISSTVIAQKSCGYTRLEKNDSYPPIKMIALKDWLAYVMNCAMVKRPSQIAPKPKMRCIPIFSKASSISPRCIKSKVSLLKVEKVVKARISPIKMKSLVSAEKDAFV